MSWRGSSVFLFFHFQKWFYVPNHVFLDNLVWVLLSNFWWKWVMKLPILCTPNTKFLRQGSASPLPPPPGGQPPGPLWTPRSQTVLPTIQNGMTPMHKHAKGAPPLFLMTVGEMSHSGELKLVEAWNLWWKWYKLRIHYKIMWILPSETGFPGLFKC